MIYSIQLWKSLNLFPIRMMLFYMVSFFVIILLKCLWRLKRNMQIITNYLPLICSVAALLITLLKTLKSNPLLKTLSSILKNLFLTKQEESQNLNDNLTSLEKQLEKLKARLNNHE